MGCDFRGAMLGGGVGPALGCGAGVGVAEGLVALRILGVHCVGAAGRLVERDENLLLPAYPGVAVGVGVGAPQ